MHVYDAGPEAFGGATNAIDDVCGGVTWLGSCMPLLACVCEVPSFKSVECHVHRLVGP